MQEDFIDLESIELFMDAAGSAGYGANFQGHWSAESWPDYGVIPGSDIYSSSHSFRAFFFITFPVALHIGDHG